MDTDDVLTLLRDVADEVITPRFRDLGSGQVHEKNPGDLVTIADREAEALITQALAGAYPGALVLGEEAEAGDPTLEERYRAADQAFTVDPVDGTRNFVHGSPDHAVMVAEIRSGTVVRSWIWQPQHQLSYVAELGAGAWRNGERLQREPLGDRLRGVTSRRSWVGRAMGALSRLELTWVCCGIDYPKLVEGDADYVLYHKASPWDHAPGSLLLSEAGCFLGTWDGVAYAPQAPRPAGLVAAADRTTYDLVQGLLSDLRPGR